MARVTVVIPTYNTAAFIKEAVDSVLAQTYPDVRLIIVDDGSTDNTRELLAPYGDRLTYLHKPNGGFASALNTGIRHSDSEFVAWLSADDVFLPEKTRLQMEQLSANRSFSISHTAFHEIDAHGKILSTVRVSPGYAEHVTISSLLRRCYVNGSTCLFRRECFEQAGYFDESLGVASDWEMWMRLARRFHFGYLPQPLVLYRKHEVNMTQARRFQVLESSYAIGLRVLREVPLSEIFDLAETNTTAGRRQAARRLYEASHKLRNLPAVRCKVLASSIAHWPWQPALFCLPAVVLRTRLSWVLKKIGLFDAAEKLRNCLRSTHAAQTHDKDAILEVS